MAHRCPCCGCSAADDGGVHALLACLRDGDLDAALERGLLGATGCPGCAPACAALLVRERDARRLALAARERHRARAARLQRRKAERESARRPQPSAPLPPAAADALARALARARERRG